MAISDEVIELETKKKGRNVLFIVLISVLAAAAVVFAVLWIVKAPAVDPPKVEKIQIGSTNMALSTGGSESDRVYSVSPGGKYTVYFDAVLKENSSTDNTNSLLQVECISQLGQFVYIDKDTGLVQDAEHPTRYQLTFSVAANAPSGAEFIFRVTSSFSPDTEIDVKVAVEESFAEVFDLTSDPKKTDADADKKYIYGSSGASYVLEQVAEKSNETVKYYKTNGLTFYEKGLEDKREYFMLYLEQLGKMGEDSVRRKVSGRQLDDGTYFDQVEVWVANKTGEEDPADEAFKLLADNGEKQTSDYLDYYLSQGQGYCHENLRIEPVKAGTTVIKLVANTKKDGTPLADNATPLTVIVEASFLSSAKQECITEIIFHDPYNPEKVTDTVNLYLGDITTTNKFRASACVSVKRNGQEIKDEQWGPNNLRLYESTASGQMSGTAGLLSVNFAAGSDAVGLSSLTKFGTTYLTIVDYDPYGFGVSKTITVNIHPRIDPQSFRARVAGNEYATEITENIFTDKSLNLALSYSIPDAGSIMTGGATKDDIIKSLNSSLNIMYADSEEILPRPDMKGKEAPKNAAETITFANMQKENGVYFVSPALKGTAAASDYTANVTLNVGNNVASQQYTVRLQLRDQALKYDEKTNTYQGSDGATITLKLNVTRIADYVRVKSMADLTAEGGAFKNDPYTLLTVDEKDASKATLSIAKGTGVGGYTSFTLADLLEYYYNDGEKTDAARDSNYGELDITFSVQSGFIKDYWNQEDGKFVVPKEDSALKSVTVTIYTKRGTDNEQTFALTIDYKMPVKYLSIKDDEGKVKEVFYSDAVETSNVVVADSLVQLHATSGEVIADLSGNTAGNIINFPQNMHIALCVWHNHTAYLLPKKEIDGQSYYFALGATEEEMANKANAYFRTDTTSFWTNKGIVRLLKDVFALDYENRETAPVKYQNLRIYYYYGESAEEMLQVEDDNGYPRITVSDEEPLVVFAEYKLIRSYNKIVEFTDSTYKKEKVVDGVTNKGAAGIHSSGVPFQVYASGVITWNDGKSEFVVKDPDNNAGNYNIDTLADPEIIKNEKVGGALTCDKKETMQDQFTATCDPEQELEVCATIVYAASHPNGCKALHIEIGVSNKALPVKEVLFYSEDPSSSSVSPLSALNIRLYNYYNPTEKKNTATIWYKVSYETYTTAYLTMAECMVAYDADVFDLTVSGFPDFNHCIKPDGTHLQNGDDYDFICKIDLKLKEGAKNGAYEVRFYAANANVNSNAEKTANIAVTTLIDTKSFNATSLKSNQGVGCSGTSKSFSVNYIPSGANTYDFEFNFKNTDGSLVDVKNLSYAMTLPSRGITGAFYDNSNGASMKGSDQEFLLTITDARAVSVKGFRLRFDGIRLINAPVTVTVTEKTLDGTDNRVYTFNLLLSVDIPVSRLSMKIGEKTCESNVDYNVTTDGRSGWQEYKLTPLYNGNDADKQPLSAPRYEFCLRALTSDSYYDVYDLQTQEGVYYLRINYNALKAPAVMLDLTATCKVYQDGAIVEAHAYTISVKLFFMGTTKLTMAFEKTDITFSETTPTAGAYTQEDNEEIDFKVIVKNAGTGIALTQGELTAGGKAAPTYTLDSESTSGLVAQNGSRFKPTGSSGSYVVRVTYTNPNDEADVLTLTVTVTLCVKVTNITLQCVPGGSEVTDLELVAGQTEGCKIYVTLTGKNGSTPANKSFTFSSLHTTVCDEKEIDDINGTLEITPVGKGTTTITIASPDGPSATIAVTVVAPTVKIESTKATYDIFTDGKPSFAVSLLDGGTNTEANLTDISLTLSDGTAFAPATYNTSTGKYEFAYANKEALTDADIKSYTVTLAAKLNGVKLLGTGNAAATCTFSLTKGSYEPSLVLKHNGTVSDELNLVNAASEYAFSIDSIPSGFGTPSVTYTVETADTITVNQSGAVTYAENAKVGNVTVWARVTLANGLTFDTSEKSYLLADSSKISNALYLTTANPLNNLTSPTSIASVFGTAIDGTSVDVGYATEDGTDRKYISLLVDYTSAPAAVTNADKSKFVVNGVTDVLEFVNSATFECAGKKYYVAVYYANKTGSITLGARTVPLGGIMYAAESVSATLTAVMPTFSFDGITESNPSFMLNPGESFTATVNGADTPNDKGDVFKGSLSYAFSVSSNAFLTKSESGNQVVVTAVTGKGGGAYTLSCTVTITSGIYKGTKINLHAGVTVNAYTAPTATAAPICNLGANETKNGFGDLLTVCADANDTAFAWQIDSVKPIAPALGSVTTLKYTAPASYGANGESFNLELTLGVTGGYYTGYTFIVIVPVTLKPTATFTIPASDQTVTPLHTVTFTPQIGDSTESFDYTATYTLSEATAGSVSGNVFTAALGTAQTDVTATITIVSGVFNGATYTIKADQTITVSGITGSALTVAPGETKNFGNLFTLGSGARFAGSVTSDLSSLFAYNAATAEFTVNRDANFKNADEAGTNKTGTIVLKQTVNGQEYYGEFALTVTPVDKPELTVTAVTRNGESGTLTEIEERDVVIEGDVLIFTLGATYSTFGAVPVDDLLNVGASMNQVVGEAAVEKSTAYTVTFTAQAATEAVTLTFVAYVYGIRVTETVTFKITAASTDMFTFSPKGVLTSGRYIDVGVAFMGAGYSNITEFVNFRVSNLSSIHSTVSKLEILYNGVSAAEYTIGANEDQYTFVLNRSPIAGKVGTNITLLTLRLYASDSVSAGTLALSPRISFKYKQNPSSWRTTTVTGGGSFGVVVLPKLPTASDVEFVHEKAVRSGESVTVASSVKDNAFAIGGIKWPTELPSGMVNKGNNVFSAVVSKLTSFTLKASVTVSGSDFTIADIPATLTFVPQNEILIEKDGASVTDFITMGETYTLSLQNELGATDVTYSVDGVTASVSGNAFTPSSLGSAHITASYTVNGIAFTETRTVTVIKAPTFGISTASESGASKYTITGVEGVTAQYKMTVKSGGELVTFGAANYGDYTQNKTYTVTPKTNTYGGTVVLVFSMQITSGVYNGVVVEQTEILPVDAFKLTVTLDGEPAANGARTYKLSTQNGSGVQYRMVVENDSAPVKQSTTQDSTTTSYTVTPLASKTGGTVRVTFYATAGGIELKQTETFAVNAVRMTVNDEYTVGVFDGYGSSVEYEVKSSNEDLATIKLIDGTRNQYEIEKKTGTKGGTVVFTFTVKVKGTKNNGTALDVITLTATKTTEVIPEVAYTGITVGEPDEKNVYTVAMVGGESGDKAASVYYRMKVIAGENLVDLGATTYDTYEANTTNKEFTVTPRTDTLGGTVTLVFYAKVQNGAYAGAEWQFVKTLTVEKPYTGITVEKSGNEYTVSMVGGESGVKAATVSYGMDVTGNADLYTLGANTNAASDGKFTVSPNNVLVGGEVTLTFYATVTSGAYKDRQFEKTVTFTVSALAVTVQKSGNTFTLSVSGNNENKDIAYKVAVTAGESLVTVSSADKAYRAGNTFTIAPRTDTLGGDVTLTFYAQIDGKEVHEVQTAITYTVAAEPAYAGITVTNKEGDDTVYIVNATGGTATLNYRMEVIAGGNLVNLGATTYGTYEANTTNKEFTVTPRTDTLGGTAILVFYAKVDGGAYNGTEWQFVKTLTVEKPYTGITVEKSGNEYTVAMVGGESGNKAAIVWYKVEVSTADESFVTVVTADKDFRAGNTFTIVPRTDTLGGTVTLKFYAEVQSGLYTGRTFSSEEVTLTVLAAPEPSVTVSPGETEVTTERVFTVQEDHSYAFTMGDIEATADPVHGTQYVTITKDTSAKTFTVEGANGYTFTTADDSDKIAVTITVEVTINDAPFGGQTKQGTTTVYVKATTPDPTPVTPETPTETPTENN